MKKRLIAALAAETVDAEARTVEVVFYTGAVVARGGFFIEPYDLVMDFDGVDLAELNGGTAPVLNSHKRRSLEDVVGHVVADSASATPGETIEAADGVSYVTGEARATLQYVDTPDVAPVWDRVSQGAARNVSMGVHFDAADTVTIGAKERLDGGAVDLVIARKWKPYEISPVPLGADPGARTLAADDDGEPDPIAERIRAQGVTMSIKTTPDPAPVDAAKLAEEAKAAGAADAFERLRVARETAKVTGYPVAKAEELAQDLDTSVDELRASMITWAAEQQPRVGGETRVEHVSDGGDRHALAVEGALYLRMSGGLYDPDTYTEMKWVGRGRNRKQVEDTAETARMRKVLRAGRDLAGISIGDLARRHIEARGIRLSRLTHEDVFALAFKDPGTYSLELRNRVGSAFAMSSSDFPKILQNITNKGLMRAYNDAPVFYEDLAWRWDVNNFNEFSLPQRGDIPAPQLIKEGGQYKRVILGERGESGRVQKKGYILAFTNEAMVNDNLSAFELKPGEIAMSFRSDEQGEFVALVEDNATLMADGVVVYATGKHTLASVSGAPDVDTAAAMQVMLARQLGINGDSGRAHNLKLYAVLGAPELGRALEVAFGPVVPPAVTLATTRQPSLSLPPGRIYTEARLSSASAWYGFADPAIAPTIAYGYIKGQEGITTETRNGWEVDGVEIKASRSMHMTRVGRVGSAKNNG